jgi:tRNA threonylcarbamoyl adenosine modification protein YeaZ
MKILALELSTARGSLAWLGEDVTDFTREWPNDRKNSALFFENLDAVTEKFGAPDTIIVGLGPGSYAGSRIAISAAIGLQISSGARLIGFPSICGMESNSQEYCVVGDARRKSFFFARIRTNDLVEGPTLLPDSDLKLKLDTIEMEIPVFTSDSLPQFERAAIRFPSAFLLAKLAREPQRSFSLPPLEPIYLREPHVTMPTRGIGILADKETSD